MAKMKKLLALGLCLCMAAGITVGCGNSKSSKNSTDSGKNTNDGLSFAFCTNTLNNTFQSSIDSKLSRSSSITAVSTLNIGIPASLISASPDVIPAESTGITNTASYPLFATSDNWLSCLFKS